MSHSILDTIAANPFIKNIALSKIKDAMIESNIKLIAIRINAETQELDFIPFTSDVAVIAKEDFITLNNKVVYHEGNAAIIDKQQKRIAQLETQISKLKNKR